MGGRKGRYFFWFLAKLFDISSTSFLHVMIGDVRMRSQTLVPSRRDRVRMVVMVLVFTMGVMMEVVPWYRKKSSKKSEI
jgi:hypothetical protein